MTGNDWFFRGLVQSITNVPLRKLRTHKASACAGEVCAVHNPSDHPMRDFPQEWRKDAGIMYRVCPHGIAHPDPDDLKVRTHPTERVHGCDGCCHGPEPIPVKESGRVRRVQPVAEVLPVEAGPAEEVETSHSQTGTKNETRGHIGMGIPELAALTNCARQWLDKAVEAFDDDEYEAVDAAYRLSAGHLELAQLEVEREKLEMARERLAMERERHRLEIRKRHKAIDVLNKISSTKPEGDSENTPAAKHRADWDDWGVTP